jgi:hypothetical protein
LYYELGADQSGNVFWRITRNDGGGFFNKKWVSVSTIRSALEQWPTDKPITSMALRPLFQGKSANNTSFLLAALLAEGAVTLMPGKRRHYVLGDLTVLPTTVAHSGTGKTTGKSKGKAASRMAAAAQKTPRAQ